MKMNVNRLFDHDEGHCTSFIKITRSNREEDWNGFCKSDDVKARRRYGISYDKFLLLQAYYKMDQDCASLDCFDESWSSSLDEFINEHKNMSVRELDRIVYSD